MAYRRKQGNSRASTFKEEIYRSPEDDRTTTTTSSTGVPSSSLAAQAIRASAAHRDSSVSSAYASSLNHSSVKDRSKGSATYDYTSMGSTNEPGGFWFTDTQAEHRYESFETSIKMDNPKLRKGLDRLASSLNQIGGTIGNALEEGRTIMDKKTQDIIQETRKLQNRRKVTNDEQNQLPESQMQTTQLQTNQETQLKASRDVAIATAAKAKLLLRELKTLKADLAFAKERSSQLEEENKMLREALEKGDQPTDDDMIRFQLESLLAEKARLANENSVYARENRFLREIVEYHQLTMQDVVYLDEGIEEVTEVNPVAYKTFSASTSPPLPSSPHASLKRTISEPQL
ncbi:hypothetical protein E3N88_42399 [Mikania micrantha]|uniref:Uncharacterized protein n=1 Tax=Mikania micrantha TaxID=192012 RepID=A0A5N6LIT6_9ASTR|nr:hypothetical protein E3N88_42399 [Mikania micrantha]